MLWHLNIFVFIHIQDKSMWKFTKQSKVAPKETLVGLPRPIWDPYSTKDHISGDNEFALLCYEDFMSYRTLCTHPHLHDETRQGVGGGEVALFGVPSATMMVPVLDSGLQCCTPDPDFWVNIRTETDVHSGSNVGTWMNLSAQAYLRIIPILGGGTISERTLTLMVAAKR